MGCAGCALGGGIEVVGWLGGGSIEVEDWRYWWLCGGIAGWVEVLVVGAHYGGWKGARTIYAD